MSEITEQDIEKYIRFPDEIGERKRAEIKRALESSQELRELASFFSEYEEHYNEVIAQSTPNVIQLHTFKSKAAGDENPNRLVLAAQTDQQSSQLETVATLASEENDTVVRVLNEPNSDYCHIHVLSELLNDEDLSILSLADIDVNLIIKEHGRLHFKPDFDIQSYHWDTSSLTLHLPVKHVKISRDSLQKTKKVENEEYTVEINEQEGNIKGKISIQEETASDISQVIVRGDQTGPYIANVTDNSFLVPTDQSDETINIWLFE